MPTNPQTHFIIRVGHYTLLTLLALLSIGPFLWLLITALKSGDENIFNAAQFLPEKPTFENFVETWNTVHIGTYMLNSIIVATLTVSLNLIFSTLAAYPLARMQFQGRQAVFLSILSTMMIPFQVIMIPLYLMMLKMGLTGNSGIGLASFFSNELPVHVWIGLIIPFAISGFGIFFVRQALIGLPKELEESAVLDGCNSFDVLVRVLVPLIYPTLATLAVFTFMASWGEFLWPSIILSEEPHFTLPVGLVYLQGAFSANWRMIAAGTVLSMLPIIVFFVILQRFFVSGNISSAVKG